MLKVIFNEFRKLKRIKLTLKSAVIHVHFDGRRAMLLWFIFPLKSTSRSDGRIFRDVIFFSNIPLPETFGQLIDLKRLRILVFYVT